MKKIGVLGLGNMGQAIGVALSKTGKYELFLYDIEPGKCKKLAKARVCKTAHELIQAVDIVIVAIKPQFIPSFLAETKQALSQYEPRLISVAAGISTKRFEQKIKGLHVIRTMPNLAAKVGESITFMCTGKYATKADLTQAKRLFSSIGQVIVTKEQLLDKVTAISGSGPGYVYYFMDSMYRSAVALGFNKADAKKMVLQTFIGAAKLAQTSGKEFQTLLSEVTSKKGTTEAALKVFKTAKVVNSINKGIKAAYKRAQAIAKNF